MTERGYLTQEERGKANELANRWLRTLNDQDENVVGAAIIRLL